ncbi:DinB family protein [Alkalibacillus almallahensis]|uniref:DinB family protein n=1 Tax=Alkalibacillus almallahensis TaxID=1379154 RepID=UPI0014202C3C|nr:DinB family protein [Alkalibacillus almallahensis]NIK12051.1 hypothetical protein [Alkalibacillus almallahensis]
MNEQTIFADMDFWRNGLIKLTESMTEEDLDRIPQGFNNNPRWNIGHALVTTDSLVTGALGESSLVPDGYAELFARGTSPNEWEDKVVPTKDALIEQLSLHNQKLQELVSGKLDQSMAFDMFHLETVEDAIKFATSHESMHSGIAKAQKPMK